MSNMTDTILGRFEYWRALRYTRSHRARLFLRLAVAIRGGLTAADALAAIANGEEEIGRAARAAVYRDIESKMRDGVHTLADALADVTTPDDRCFLMAEEQVTDVSTLFQMAYDAIIRRKVIVDAVTKPFLFPAYLGVLGISILILGGTVMLPNFIVALPIEHWETPSVMVYWIGKQLRAYGPLIAPAIFGGLAWVWWSLPNLFTEVRTTSLDRIFPWSLYRTLSSSNFLVSMAALFSAKVPMLEAVSAYQRAAQPYQSGYASQMMERLGSEQTSTDMRALDVGFIDLETMMSMKVLNVKLSPQEIITRIGESEMDLLVQEVTDVAKGISRGVVLVFAAVLVFGLYGTFSVIPTLTEKAMAVHGMRK